MVALRRSVACAPVLAWCSLAVVARADATVVGRVGLPAVEHVYMPVQLPARFTLAGSAGYGVTESLSGEGAHHRLETTLAGAVAPLATLPGLALSLGVDARADMHPDSLDAMLAAPRASVFYAHAVGEKLQLGAAASFELTGFTRPALARQGTALTGLLLGAFRPSRSTVFSAQLGWRWDHTASAAREPVLVPPAQRLTFELSEFHAVPVGISVYEQLGKLGLGFELSGDIALGSRAPAWLDSPLRAAGVGRFGLAAGLSAELSLRVGLSRRADDAPSAPLIPVEPRVVLGLGLRFAPDARPRLAAAPALEGRTSLRGVVRTDQGAPLPAAQITLRMGASSYRVHTRDDGRFELHELPRGRAVLSVSADDMVRQERALMLDRAEIALELRVTPRARSAQLSGIVRSFAGAPLPAHVRVLPGTVSIAANPDGRFDLELPPGDYQVEIACDGYVTQRRRVRVQQNGVIVLNIELRAAQQ